MTDSTRVINRLQNYLLSLASGLGSMVIQNLLSILSVPLALSYFGVERYGIWALLNSTLIYFSISGLGLETIASIVAAKTNNPGLKRLVLGRCMRLIVLSSAAGLACFLTINWLVPDWYRFLGQIPASLKHEVSLAALVLAIGYLVALPFTLANSGFIAYQRLYIVKIYQTVTVILNFAALLLAIGLQGGLVLYAALNVGSNLLLGTLKALHVYLISRESGASRSWEHFEEEFGYVSLLKGGTVYFFAGIAAILQWTVDSVIVANVLGFTAAAAYTVVYRLLSLGLSLINTTASAVMPLVGRELGAQNWPWLKATYAKMLVTVLFLGGLVCCGGLFLGRDFIAIWTAGKVQTSLWMLAPFAAYGVVNAYVTLNWLVINAMNRSVGLLRIAYLELVLKIALCFVLSKSHGAVGVAWGCLIACLLTSAWLVPAELQKQSEGRLSMRGIVMPLIAKTVLPLSFATPLLYLIESMGVRLGLGVLGICLYVGIFFRAMPAEYRHALVNHGRVRPLVARFWPSYGA